MICVYIYIYIYICIYLYLSLYLSLSLYVYIYIYIHTSYNTNNACIVHVYTYLKPPPGLRIGLRRALVRAQRVRALGLALPRLRRIGCLFCLVVIAYVMWLFYQCHAHCLLFEFVVCAFMFSLRSRRVRALGLALPRLRRIHMGHGVFYSSTRLHRQGNKL